MKINRHHFLVVASISFWIVPVLTLRAQVPQLINYQGRIAVSGTNFTGAGQFAFALVSGTDAATSYWSNDGTSTAGSQPGSAVTLTVASGLYSVLLGDTTRTNMTAGIPAGVFSNSDVRLRVWFNDGTNGWQQLAPDQRIGAVGYALMTQGLNLPATTSGTAGVIMQAGAPLIHSFGSQNFFAGPNAGNFTVTGSGNTAAGSRALANNIAGSNNIALGNSTGNLITGSNNIDIGNSGVAGESGIIRIGDGTSQTDIYLTGTLHGNGSGLTGISYSGSAAYSTQSGTATTISGTIPASQVSGLGSSGGVSSVSATGANGVSVSVTNPATTPAITITLGTIAPTAISTGTAVFASTNTGTDSWYQIQNIAKWAPQAPTAFNSYGVFSACLFTGTHATIGGEIAGLFGEGINDGGANVYQVAGVVGRAGQGVTQTSGTVTNAIDFHGLTPDTSGSTQPITNAYGLLLDKQARPSVTNAYAIKTDGGDLSLLGPVAISSNAMGTGVTKFSVTDFNTITGLNQASASINTVFTPGAADPVYSYSAFSSAIGIQGANSLNGTGYDAAANYTAYSQSSGTIASIYGILVAGGNLGSGKLTNYASIYIASPYQSGTITNDYGVYIKKQNGTGVVNPYGIYQADAGDSNRFTGPTTFSNGIAVTSGTGTITGVDRTVVVTGTLVSGTSAITNAGISTGIHPWVQSTGTGGAATIGSLSVVVSGNTARITSSLPTDTSTFTLYVPNF